MYGKEEEYEESYKGEKDKVVLANEGEKLLQRIKGGIIECFVCGGNHYTSQSPKKGSKKSSKQIEESGKTEKKSGTKNKCRVKGTTM
eukprot:10225044-Ditylum_brightwellii.AAC.1